MLAREQEAAPKLTFSAVDARPRSGKGLQIDAKPIGARAGEEALERRVGPLPNRDGLDKQSPAARGQHQAAASFVGMVDGHLRQAATLKRLELGGEGRAIHGKQSGNLSHARRLGTIERHQERELAIGQPQRPQRVVKAPCHHPRRPLDMETEAGIANLVRNCEGKIIAT